MSLIGISGKISSGKDTVGTIIQCLTYENKDHVSSVEDIMMVIRLREGKGELPSKNLPRPKFKVRKFADKLKDIECTLIGCTREQLEDRDFKETPLGPEWDFYEGFGSVTDKRYISLTKDFDGSKMYSLNNVQKKQMTPRLMLQLLGTECGRQIIHPQIWVNSLFADYKEGSHWIITDMRFPNELKSIKDRGGVTIRVNRSCKNDTDGDGNCSDNPSFCRCLNQHTSETALDDAQFDYTIHNNGTIEDLIESVREVLRKERVI